jgi:hypothetical protein
MEGRQVEDTTDFFAIDYGDVILVGDKKYTVTGNERERRFGIESPKFWVKRALDTETEEKKIIKLAFLESFEITLGGVRIRCFRNPDKEEEILALVRDHPHFMHGTSHKDSKGNSIRILDIVRGQDFFVYIDSIGMGHESYFQKMLPGIMKKLVQAFEAIRFLHVHGFRHGDIRNDHIIIERDTGNYVWIDFDYDYEAGENPFGLDIFGLGSILLYAIGKGFHNLHMIENEPFIYGDLKNHLEPGDFSILDKWRFINLRKLYPYIPATLNDVLMHFSRGASVYYEFVEEVIEDLNRCIHAIFE